MRGSAGARFATRIVSTPLIASAMAAVSPAGPAPTITHSVLKLPMLYSSMTVAAITSAQGTPGEGEVLDAACTLPVYCVTIAWSQLILPPLLQIRAFAVHILTAAGAAFALAHSSLQSAMHALHFALCLRMREGAVDDAHPLLHNPDR